mmetsp:Transcript_24580/g.92897  ORF Transcript_24580/g.92897 Transcript_24580/m.92897 type:complete len:331 (-) Transcript_24580:58-1050(-)
MSFCTHSPFVCAQVEGRSGVPGAHGSARAAAWRADKASTTCLPSWMWLASRRRPSSPRITALMASTSRSIAASCGTSLPIMPRSRGSAKAALAHASPSAGIGGSVASRAPFVAVRPEASLSTTCAAEAAGLSGRYRTHPSGHSTDRRRGTPPDASASTSNGGVLRSGASAPPAPWASPDTVVTAKREFPPAKRVAASSAATSGFTAAPSHPAEASSSLWARRAIPARAAAALGSATSASANVDRGGGSRPSAAMTATTPPAPAAPPSTSVPDAARSAVACDRATAHASAATRTADATAIACLVAVTRPSPPPGRSPSAATPSHAVAPAAP